ncbi:hypothetical protein [Pseudomonas sp. PA27(2017)]|uniref:hypothetical protein n=1 Tax=Pseudomonas sp. PA27(2017) TaxID=1932112 RepID=UPI00095E550A|nr:hypothetical protein [Pseudomonas sp. PA27(2017)]OLU24201.1 hypothetical protein BVH06_23905 [Pseudomonas sp. PA27(2017)]
MALINSLMRYKMEKRISSFNMITAKKAEILLPNGSSFLIYMSDQYIIGETEIQEAIQAPKANFIIYNNWDNIAQSAIDHARRNEVEVHKFGAFGHKLDEM